ncbi:MAG: glycosyltransferase family 4 protein [Candidatus Delongbacteria bacterium]|nr:glycosyltransferase family 4 protein [Candidatus Delongbacteria bacterium]
MKILLINAYAIPAAWGGGTRHYSLCQELIARGHEVLLCASSFDHVSKTERRLKDDQEFLLQEEQGVPFLWLRTTPYAGNTGARVRNMLSFASRVRRGVGLPTGFQPDLVLASTPHLFAADAGRILARRLKVPFVLEVRDLWPETLLELGGISPWHPFILWLGILERRVYRNSVRIISLLPGAWQHLETKGAPRSKVHWLPNGVDLSLLPPVSPPPVNERFTVMYAGAHGLANGLDSILDAAAILQSQGYGEKIRLVFMGQGTAKPALVERARSEGLGMVEFRDPVPKEQVYAVLQQADAYVATLKDSPLYRYGISLNKIYDYLALGRPTVFGVRSYNNPVDEASAGISTAPESAVEIADALKHLMQLSPEERQEMGQRGRAFIESQHEKSILGARFERLLSEVLEA